jgi:hypothetical protein
LPFSHPFGVLLSFLQTYSQFNWERYVVTTDGAVPIQNGTMSAVAAPGAVAGPGGKELMLDPLMRRFRSSIGATLSNGAPVGGGDSGPHPPPRFQLRACNIQVRYSALHLLSSISVLFLSPALALIAGISSGPHRQQQQSGHLRLPTQPPPHRLRAQVRRVPHAGPCLHPLLLTLSTRRSVYRARIFFVIEHFVCSTL